MALTLKSAPNTKSTVGLVGGTNRTSVSLSTNIILYVNGTPVGAVQELQITESRNIQMINELSSAFTIDSSPHAPATFSGTCRRIRFDKMRIAEAFSRGFVHVHSQVYPFDIVILDRQTTDAASQITTVIKNVWINSLTTTYSASDWIISDNMGWAAESISSINGKGDPAAQGGTRGVAHTNITLGTEKNIEQLVDSGARGGGLDAAGLIDLDSTNSVLF
jgi:hypothetical protein